MVRRPASQIVGCGFEPLYLSSGNKCPLSIQATNAFLVQPWQVENDGPYPREAVADSLAKSAIKFESRISIALCQPIILSNYGKS